MVKRSRDKFLRDFVSQVDKLETILSRTHRSVEKISGGNISFRDSFMLTLRDYFLLGSVMESLNLEPTFLVMNGKTFNKEMILFAHWRERRDPLFGDSNAEFDWKASLKEHWKYFLTFTLNLASSFLFMMNYYIVEPTSVQYVRYVGGHDALAGMLIGALPFASLISSFSFSIWATRSFRSPLLFSGILLLSGNLLYSSAYSHNSLAFMMAGRALTGLGGARVVNKRLIADTTPIEYRTMASASFATANACGAASGPAFAILLSYQEFQFSIFGTKIYVNSMTAPGYFMFVLWVIWLVLTYFFFTEPERSGLAEQKAINALNQKKRAIAASSSGIINLKASPSMADTNIYECVDSDDEDDNQVESTPEKKEIGVIGEVVGCCTAVTPGVWICMLLIAASKFALESLISATTILTVNRYGWTVQKIGLLGLTNGLLVIPLSILVGYLSQYMQDRDMILTIIAAAILGTMLLTDYSDFHAAENMGYNYESFISVGAGHFVCGSILLFCSLQACESVEFSLLSKVIPISMATGTFNCGLLATLVATFGRALGDVFITCMGFTSIRNLLNLLFVPCTFLLCFLYVLIRSNFDLFDV
mmetsp:Transcript_36972/g.44555  ORF Transcript_36972/g.44555 Transcript_36972/m.44555 type:complete len:592 (+) Transcript_36972:2-1777(+)